MNYYFLIIFKWDWFFFSFLYSYDHWLCIVVVVIFGHWLSSITILSGNYFWLSQINNFFIFIFFNFLHFFFIFSNFFQRFFFLLPWKFSPFVILFFLFLKQEPFRYLRKIWCLIGQYNIFFVYFLTFSWAKIKTGSFIFDIPF